MSITVYIEHGKELVLASEIGRGGEGTIYASPLDKSECAKIYTKSLSKEDDRKLALMVQNPPRDPTYDSRKHHSIAWPTALLFRDAGCSQPVGFLMPRADIKIFQKAMSYMDPSDRTRLFGGGFNWKYLFTTAFNIVSCVAAIHEKGYCIGDINESNILVARNALIMLIDCDSFQVPDRSTGRNYRCLVGKPEYTAPELQRKPYGEVDRTQASDCFALAVLVFQLLMEGTHPYQAKGKLVEDATSTQAKIVKGFFPYTMQSRNIAAPDHAPSFTILHPEIQRLFQRCFVEGHQDPSARPLATEWFETLKNLGAKFRQCTVNQNHLFLDHLNPCPWCERARATGKDPFPSPVGQQIALDDPGLIRDSLDKRLDYFSTYVAMALADGILTTEEESQLHAQGSKLQIPAKDIEKAIQAEAKKVNARTSSSGGGVARLEISRSVFGFQNLRVSSTAQDSFVVSNIGGGNLQGSVRSNRTWLKPSQTVIDPSRHRQEISFVVNTSGLPLGLKEQGQIEISSNGGIQTITVDMSVEVPDAAIARFRNGLFWLGFCGGGLFGFLLYQLLSNAPSRDFITGLAGFVGVGVAVIAASKVEGLAGGCGALILGGVILGILSAYWPVGFSTLSWAITYGAFLHLTSRKIFVAKQTKRKVPVFAVAVGATALSLLVIATGFFLGNAAESYQKGQKSAADHFLQRFVGHWRGTAGNHAVALVIAQDTKARKLQGYLTCASAKEELSIELQGGPRIVLRDTTLRMPGSARAFVIQTLDGNLTSDERSMTGTYVDWNGRHGSWTLSKIGSSGSVANSAPHVVTEPHRSSTTRLYQRSPNRQKDASPTSSESEASSVSEGGLTLTGQSCVMSGGVLTCTLIIANHGPDAEFHLNAVCGSGPPSKVVDLAGHEYVASKSQLANHLSQRPASCEWVGDVIRQGVPETGILTFRNVPPDFSGVGALVVGFWADTNHSVTIRNLRFYNNKEATSSKPTAQLPTAPYQRDQTAPSYQASQPPHPAFHANQPPQRTYHASPQPLSGVRMFTSRPPQLEESRSHWPSHSYQVSPPPHQSVTGSAGCADYDSCSKSGWAATNAHNYDQAVRDFQVAASMQPTNPGAWTALGLNSFLSGQYQGMTEAYDQALQLGGTLGIAAWAPQWQPGSAYMLHLSVHQVGFAGLFSVAPSEITSHGTERPSEFMPPLVFVLRAKGQEYRLYPYPSGLLCGAPPPVCAEPARSRQAVLAQYIDHAVSAIVSGTIIGGARATGARDSERPRTQ